MGASSFKYICPPPPVQVSATLFETRATKHDEINEQTLSGITSVLPQTSDTRDSLTLMAERVLEAKEHARAWNAIVRAYEQALMRLQSDKSAVYKDIAVNLRQAVRKGIDGTRLADVLRASNAPTELLYTIIGAVKI